jgi:hypothetical protein
MTEPTRPSGEWQPIDTDRLSVPVAYLTVDDARWLAGVFADLATRAHRRAVAAFFRSTGQVLAELAEDKQDAGERAIFRFRAELAVPGELEKGLARVGGRGRRPAARNRHLLTSRGKPAAASRPARGRMRAA